MSIFPGAISSFAGFTSSHTLAADNHAAQHNSEQAEIVAVQTKVGTGASTPTSGVVLRGTGVGTSAWADVDLTTDVTGVLPVANGGTGGSTAANARTSLGVNTQLETLAAVYPIGCIYTTTNSTNPASILGFGTWAAYGAGRVLVGAGTSDQAFAGGATGGESNHTLTVAEVPALSVNAAVTNAGSLGLKSAPDFATTLNQAVSTTGGGGSHNNLQSYIVVYFWNRTA